MFQRIVMVSLVVLFAACTQSAKKNIIRKDLDALCKQTELVLASESDPTEQALRMSQAFAERPHHPDVQEMWKALSAVDPTQKYSLLLRFAHEDQGLKDWQGCPALDRFFSQAAAPVNSQ